MCLRIHCFPQAVSMFFCGFFRPKYPYGLPSGPRSPLEEEGGFGHERSLPEQAGPWPSQARWGPDSESATHSSSF